MLNFRPIVAIYDRFLNKIRFTVRKLTFLTIYAPFLNQTLNCPYWRLWALRKNIQEIKKKSAKAVFLSRDIRIYGTKSAQNPGKHGPGPFTRTFFFSKILAKYFLRYRDFGDFLGQKHDFRPLRALHGLHRARTAGGLKRGKNGQNGQKSPRTTSESSSHGFCDRKSGE